MGYILSVDMSSSEKMCTLAELSTITIDPSESNPTCSDSYTLEESMWHILYFEILQKKKGLFLVWHWGGFFIGFQLGSLEFGLSLLIMHFCLQSQFLEPLSI